MPWVMDVQPHAAALATIACMDFDRLTITLLELRDEAPGLTSEQEDAHLTGSCRTVPSRPG